MLTNQIQPTTLSVAIVFRVHPFLAKKHREFPFLAIAQVFFLPCHRSLLKIWSRETSLAVPSRVSLLILHYMQTESVLGYSRDSSR